MIVFFRDKRVSFIILLMIFGYGALFADSLTVIGRLSLPFCTNVFARRSICYATDAYGLEAIDVSNPSNPVLIGRCPLPDTGEAVVVVDSIGYVSDGDSGLAVVKLVPPESLRLLSRWRDYEGHAYEAAVNRDTVFLAYGFSTEGRFPPYRGGLMMIDVRDPRMPTFLRFFAEAYSDTFPPYQFRYVIYSSVGIGNGGFYVAASVLYGDYIGSISFGSIDPVQYGTSGQLAYDRYSPLTQRKMALKYPYAYITYPRWNPRNFSIIHFSAPFWADTMFEYDFGGNGKGLYAESANAIYVTLDSTVKLIDASVPSAPRVLAACSLGEPAFGIHAVDPYVYVANGRYLTVLRRFPSGVSESIREIAGSDGSWFISAPSPNPFWGSTRLNFKGPTSGPIKVAVYDVLGRRVKQLYQGLTGRDVHTVHWRGENEKGEPVPEGVYFCQIKMLPGGQAKTQKIIRLKAP